MHILLRPLFCSLLLTVSGYAQAQSQAENGQIIQVDVFGKHPEEYEHKINLVVPDTMSKGDLSETGPIPIDKKHMNAHASDQHVWVVKLNPFLLIHGEIPVYLERKLAKSFSLEAGLGLTTEDYFKDFLLLQKLIIPRSPNVEKLGGVTAKLALKYYLKHTALTNVYISPEVDYKNYRKYVSGTYSNSGGNFSRGRLLDQQKYMDYTVVVGSKKTTEWDHDLYFDWYIGAGLRSGTEDNVVIDENNPLVIRLKTVNVISPLLVFGIKLGLGF
jgi:hypothetical protein